MNSADVLRNDGEVCANNRRNTKLPMLDRILILGAGKIARSLVAALPESPSIFLSSRTSTEASGATWVSLDRSFEEIRPQLVILATAWPMADAYIEVSGRLNSNVPVLSIAKAASLRELRAIFGDRPLARFLCSVAVSDPTSLRFYDQDSSPEALQALMENLPAADWKAIPGEKFERYGQLLACSAAHCATLCLLSQSLDCSTQEGKFLAETLMEAYRLLNKENAEPLKVLEQSMTPGGNTEALCRSLFRQGNKLSDAVLLGRSHDSQQGETIYRERIK